MLVAFTCDSYFLIAKLIGMPALWLVGMDDQSGMFDVIIYWHCVEIFAL